MDWELTKENCVPVRQGRSGAALQELADPAAEALETKRRELWSAVQNYQGDDPLDAWQKYIKWMQEYGVGGGKADLQRVLEACTKEMQKLERYNNDVRYLRIWITYADCLPDPGDVFLFLKEKGIGQDFALYYDAYATYFELKGNFPGADAVFMDGVKRGAKPLERLKQKHTAFQQRMAHRMQRRMEDEQLMGSQQPEPARSSLAFLGGSLSRTARAAGQQRVIGAAAPQSASLFGSKPSQLSMRGSRLGAGMLEDDEFTGGENAVGLPGYSCMPQVNNLRELKPYGVIRKENLDRPATWGQALFPTASIAATGPSAGGGLEIFTDEEFQAEEEELLTGQAARVPIGFSRPASTIAASAGHPLLGPSIGSVAPGVDSLMSSLALPPSLLRSSQPGGTFPPRGQPVFPAMAQPAADPFSVPGSGMRTDVPSSKLDVHPCANVAPPSGQVLASSAACAVGPSIGSAETSPTENQAADSEGELSYEELRAVAWFQRNPLIDSPASDLENMSCSQEKHSMKRSHAAALGAENGAAAACTGLASVGRPLADMAGQTCTAFAPAARRKPFGQMTSLAAPSQPENINDENGVVASTTPGRPPGVTPPLATAPPVENPGLKTSRPALSQHPSAAPAACVSPPVASMPALATNGSAVCSREHKHDDLQATVTISTRGAFDLMNSFFSEDLPHQQQRSAQSRKPESQACAQSQQAMAPPVPLATSTRAPASAPQAPPAFAPEATVTLHTRQAFDTLNDMFNETLPHEAARKLARRAGFENGGITYSKPISTSDVCRLANAGRSFGGGNTTVLGNAGPSNPAGAPGAATAGSSSQASLSIHEDTFLFGSSALAAPAGDENRFGCPEEQGLGIGGIYEDTDFLPKAPARGAFARGLSSNAGAQGQVAVLEDTDFLTLGATGSHNAAPSAAKRQVRDSSRVSVAQPASAGARRPFQSRPTSSLQIYEDTQYLE